MCALFSREIYRLGVNSNIGCKMLDEVTRQNLITRWFVVGGGGGGFFVVVCVRFLLWGVLGWEKGVCFLVNEVTCSAQ